LLDDGAASSNAITFKNFLDASKDKIFKGEGLDYFKQIIKSTIATELAADKDFIKSIYDLIVDKLIENESSKLSNLFSKIKSRLTNNISSATLSRSDDLLIMPSSDTIQKTRVPEQLLGVPSNLEYGGIIRSTTLYSSDYEHKVISINMEDNDDVTLIFYKSYDNSPVYLDIEIQVKINNNRMQKKSLNLQYSDETTYNWVYEIAGPRGLFTRIPIYKGWYIQKRAYRYGDSVPDLLKL
ncbi:DUF685 domain-containing protein, partial [Borreliella burgdorferi]|uniref:DUF685 domain-containing protein n=1 Tax=Borreliella burgdorferi TaxID=139 RepID=UPI000D042AAC